MNLADLPNVNIEEIEKFKERNVGKGSIIPEPKFDFKKPMICLNIFKFNNYSGLLLFLSIILI